MLKPTWNLTSDGAVAFSAPNGQSGYMHPDEFKRMFGAEAWRDLLTQPVLVSEYDGCDCPSCRRANHVELDS